MSFKLIDEETEDRSLPFVKTIIAGIVLGLVGVYLRFADFKHSSEVADVIMGIATILTIKTVFDWLKVPAPRTKN
jgi:hypothetical protein